MKRIFAALISVSIIVSFGRARLAADYDEYRNPKSVALGFAGTARWDAGGLGLNPAAAGSFNGRALIMGSAMSPFDEAASQSLLYHWNMGSSGLNIHVVRKEVPGIKIIDESNTYKGEAAFQRGNAGAALGYKFTRRAAIGLGAKYRHDTFNAETLNSDFSLDAGAIFGVNEKTDVGFGAFNVTSGRHNLLSAGVLYESGSVILLADANLSPFYRRIYFGCGTEVSLSELFCLRIGYKTGPAPLEHGMLSGLTGGFGVRHGIFEFDYSFSPVMDLGIQHFAGLSLLFDVERGARLPPPEPSIEVPTVKVEPPQEAYPAKEYYEQKEKRSADSGVVEREIEGKESAIKNALQQYPISRTRPEEATKIEGLLRDAQQMMDRGQTMEALSAYQEAEKKTREEVAKITRQLESQKQVDVRQQEWLKYVADTKVSLRGNKYLAVEETRDTLILNLVGLKSRLGGHALNYDSQMCLNTATEVIQKGGYDITVEFGGRNKQDEFRSANTWIISSGVDPARMKQILNLEGEEKKVIIIHRPK